MVFYYLIWFIIAVFNTLSPRIVLSKLIFGLMFFVLFIMTALRYEIGGDWSNYLTMYSYFNHVGFGEAMLITDPGYALFNYLSRLLGISDTILVNTLCAFIFYICLYKVCRGFQYYWLPLLISFPYLILVVSMGYTRQSVAIALALLAVKYALNKKNIYFVFTVIIALFFHKTALIMFMFLPFSIMNDFFKHSSSLLIYAFFSFLIISAAVYYSSLSGDNIYTDQTSGVSSSGALFRVVVHFLTLLFYLIYRKNIKLSHPNLIRLFDYMSLLVVYVFLLAIPFSTLADRFNLYLISYDIFVLTLLAGILIKFNRYFMIGSVIFFNSFMLIIWLNFGAWSNAWLPYNNYLNIFLSGAL